MVVNKAGECEYEFVLANNASQSDEAKIEARLRTRLRRAEGRHERGN